MHVRLFLAVPESVLAHEAIAAEDVEVAPDSVVVFPVRLETARVEPRVEGVNGSKLDVVRNAALLDVELYELVEQLRGRRAAET